MTSKRRYVGFARRPIEEWELATLLEQAPPKRRLCYLLAADSGMRRAEVFRALRSDCAGDRIRIPEGKDRKSRWTILSARTINLISAAPDQLCPHTYHSLGEMFKYDRDRAGLARDLSLHSLRHRFATMLLREGINLYDIMDLLGHSSLATTAIYLHSDPRRFSAARAAIEGVVTTSSLFREERNAPI